MKKLTNLMMVWLFTLMACAPDNQTKKAKRDYIINPPDFEELERQKTAWAQGKPININKNKKPSLSKDDSLKNYVKELSHHFHLQEKQMKALEYIYAKYDKMETHSIQLGDTAQLAKLTAEKEKSIAVVLGEHYYAKKEGFDEKYASKFEKEQLEKIKLTKSEQIYLSALSTKLKLDKDKSEGLKLLLKNYKLKIDGKRGEAVKALDKEQTQKEKELLGDVLYFRKVAFDRTHDDYQNKKQEIAALKPLTLRTMRTLNFNYQEAKTIEQMDNKNTQKLIGLLGEYNYLRLTYFTDLFQKGHYKVSQGNIWLNKKDTEYLKALKTQLKLSKKEVEDLEICIYHFSILNERSTNDEIAQNKVTQEKVEKTILGALKYKVKLEFDKTAVLN